MFCLEPTAQPQRKPPTETVEIDSKLPAQTTDINATKPDATEPFLLEDEIRDDDYEENLDEVVNTLFGITSTTTKPEVVDEILDDDASADKNSSEELPVTESPIDEDKQSLPVEVPDFDPTAPGEDDKEELPLEIPGFSKDDIKNLEADLFDGDTKVDGDEKIDAKFPVTDENTQDMEEQSFDEFVDNRFSDEKESDEQKESAIIGIGGMKGLVTSTGLTGETLAGNTFISSSFFFSSPNKVPSISVNSSGKDGAGSTGLVTSTELTVVTLVGKMFFSSSVSFSLTTSGLVVVVVVVFVVPNRVLTTSSKFSS